MCKDILIILKYIKNTLKYIIQNIIGFAHPKTSKKNKTSLRKL